MTDHTYSLLSVPENLISSTSNLGKNGIITF